MGSYRSVEVNRLVCAGKRLHDALVEQGDASVNSISSKYLQECQVMLSIKASLPIPNAYSLKTRSAHESRNQTLRSRRKGLGTRVHPSCPQDGMLT